MSEPNNISGKGQLTDEQLLAYLEGKLSVEEQRRVEELLSEEGAESDAIDGLVAIQTEEVKHLASRINYKLKNDLRKQNRTRRNYYTDNKWGWLAVLIVLLLSVLAYVVIKSI